jgi:aldehyde dehydrogenase (NAD+)
MVLAVAEEARRIFELQAEYKWEVKASTLERRKETLRRLRAVIVTRAGDIQAALTEDLVKPGGESASEVESVVRAIDEAVENLSGWAQPVLLQPSPGFEGTEPAIVYEGRGVCLIFDPWNLPFQLLFEPLVPALAGGNTAILKPNEVTPTVARVSADIVRAVFDERDVAIFVGGVEVANILLELPVDHIFFTGSPAVGKIVMAAAAKHLATVTLELGGKCPAIVDGTHDLAESAQLVAFGRHLNGGQVCLAPDHVWVRAEVKDPFLQHYNAWIDEHLYRDGQLDPGAISHIVDERNLQRVLSYIEDARERAAAIVRGGDRSSIAADLIEPTIIIDSPLDSQVMTQEIFGPVLPVQTFTEVSEVIDYLRRGQKPLAMYVYSDDSDFIDSILEGTSSGGATINGFATHIGESQLPFGGVNHSGMGRYHGIHGFKEFSNERSIVRHVTPQAAPRGS